MIINLTSAAIILWSGMLIIAGTLLVLSSQVRHLVDLLENRPEAPAAQPVEVRRGTTLPPASIPNRTRNAGSRGLGRNRSLRQALRADA